MSEIIRVLFIVLLSVSSLVMSMNISVFARSTKFLKEDIEIAVHDASLAIDEIALSNGQIVFNETKAKDNFIASFESNTGFSSNDYKILDFKVFDQTNSTFPVKYEPVNINFEDTFSEPTVFAIVETTTKKYFFGNSKEKIIRRVASYSYKQKKIPGLIPGMPTAPISGLTPNINGFYWPVPFTQNITSSFDPNRQHPITGIYQPHNGMDISFQGILNKEVVSGKNGTVVFSGLLGGYGNLIIIDHGGGLQTRYAHLNAIYVKSGDSILGGQVIGAVGSTGDSTGPHLHFETRVNGSPVDPRTFY